MQLARFAFSYILRSLLQTDADDGVRSRVVPNLNRWFVPWMIWFVFSGRIRMIYLCIGIIPNFTE